MYLFETIGYVGYIPEFCITAPFFFVVLLILFKGHYDIMPMEERDSSSLTLDQPVSGSLPGHMCVLFASQQNCGVSLSHMEKKNAQPATKHTHTTHTQENIYCFDFVPHKLKERCIID
jgi:hypothetical protein